MMLCRRSLAQHRKIKVAQKQACRPLLSCFDAHASPIARQTHQAASRYAAAAAGPAAAGSISLTYHQSSPMQQQQAPHARLTSSKSRIVGSGRICGSTSCYLKLDQCRLGLLVVCDFLCSVVVNNLEHQTITLLFFLLIQRTHDCIKKEKYELYQFFIYMM